MGQQLTHLGFRAALAGIAMAGFAWTSDSLAGGSDLRVFDWSGYEDQGFFKPYMDKHGSAPSYAYFASEEEAYTKLRSGFKSDLAHPCTGVTKKWAAAKLIKPLDPSRLKNWDKLLPAIKESGGLKKFGKRLERMVNENNYVEPGEMNPIRQLRYRLQPTERRAFDVGAHGAKEFDTFMNILAKDQGRDILTKAKGRLPIIRDRINDELIDELVRSQK